MSHPNKPKSSSDSPPRNSVAPVAGRRRLLRGGLAAAPVLMTLVSRPVLAQQCTTPSGFVSANASTAGRGVTCSGHTPEYWVSHTDSWPGQGSNKYKTNDKFKKYFSPDLSGSPTLIEALAPAFPSSVARYCVAALLNTGPPSLTPVLSPSAVKDIWSEFATSGSFSPSSGAHWNATEIIDYLLTTMS